MLLITHHAYTMFVMTPSKFRKVVLDYYRAHGRHHLPWRRTRDPYHILVSEVMLQQTQVDRVIPFYKDFIRSFPTLQALAKAPLARVLTHWQGLGYNRRAKMLHEAAKAIVLDRGGRFPTRLEDIESLPGVGPYTARAVVAFAYDRDEILIETNIRTAIVYHFFPDAAVSSDDDIRNALDSARPKIATGRKSNEIVSARIWNAALMDYGAALKRQGVRTNARVKGYTKQKRFDGSLRQARGAVLRALVGGPMTGSKLSQLLGTDREAQVKGALASLTKEGLVELQSGRFRLPGSTHFVSRTMRRAPKRR